MPPKRAAEGGAPDVEAATPLETPAMKRRREGIDLAAMATSEQAAKEMKEKAASLASASAAGRKACKVTFKESASTNISDVQKDVVSGVIEGLATLGSFEGSGSAGLLASALKKAIPGGKWNVFISDGPLSWNFYTKKLRFVALCKIAGKGESTFVAFNT